MQFHVGRNGNPLGQYTLEELKDGVQNGLFQISDLVWTEGMSEWKPIREALPEVLPKPPGIPLMPTTEGNTPSLSVLPPPSQDFRDTRFAGASLPVAGLATTSMWLGIAAFLLCCCHPLPAIPAIAAVITGHMASSEIRQSEGTKRGKGFAITGLILGYLIILITILLFFSDSTSITFDGEELDSSDATEFIEKLKSEFEKASNEI